MTTSPLLNQLGGFDRDPTGGAPRRAGGASEDADAFRAALRLANGPRSGAATALLAQVPTDQAQGTPQEESAAAPEDDDSTNEESASEERAETPPQVAAGVPLTIDTLNALLLVGGGTRANAAKTARAELGAAAERSTDPTMAAGETSRTSRRSESGNTPSDAPREGGDPPRPNNDGAPRHSDRADPGRPTGDPKSNDGDRSAASSRPIPEGIKPLPASRADTTDFTRTLALRALTPPSSPPSAASGVRGSPATSPLTLRPVTGPRAEAPTRTTQPADSTSTEARKAAFAAQMSRVLTTAAAKGGGSMTMRLAPESLGALTVRVGVEGGVVSASFEAASVEARDLLDTTLSALRSSLEAKGLSVERLHVELAAPESPRHPEDQGARGAFGGEQSESGGAGSGGSADRGHAGEPGGGESGSARGDAEASAAAVPGGRTEAPDGTDGHAGALYLGLDAVA